MCHDKSLNMLFYDNEAQEWQPVPTDLLHEFKSKWNNAPAARLLPNGKFGIQGKIFEDGTRKVFNEYKYEWATID